MFVLYRARMSGEFNSKDSQSTKFERRPRIFLKLRFNEWCDSRLSGLHPFDKIHWVKNRSRTERQAVSSWDINPCSYFCDPHWELICPNKQHPGNSEISTLLEIAVGTHFLVWDDTETTPVFLPADGGASWLLLPSSVSLLSGGTVQPEKTYSCILKMTVQVWGSQKTTSINTNHSYY